MSPVVWRNLPKVSKEGSNKVEKAVFPSASEGGELFGRRQRLREENFRPSSASEGVEISVI